MTVELPVVQINTNGARNGMRYDRTPFVIRNHERLLFKGCRRKWHFAARQPGCLGLEKKERHSALWIGTGVHVAMQHYYARGIERGASPVETFATWANNWRKTNRNIVIGWDDEERLKYQADWALAIGMLEHYRTAWAPEQDNFEVLQSEQEFMIPILDERGRPTWVTDWVSHPYPVRRPAYYAGRFDGLVRTKDGLIWLLEHKTAEYLDIRKLANDEQVGSYVWAAKRLYGIDIAGVLYNVLFKRLPSIPDTVYKGTALSKSQATLATTTYDLYLKSIQTLGFRESDYAEQLIALQSMGLRSFFQREIVMRSAAEIEEIGMRIYYEALDITRKDLFIYPNAVPMICPWCPFREPCQAMSDGDDYDYLLSEHYQPRVNDFEPASEVMPY